eukprot:3623960-Pleurochrysis_carterae.AAC.1
MPVVPCPRVSTCQRVRLSPQWQSESFAHVTRASRRQNCRLAYERSSPRARSCPQSHLRA